MNLFSIRNFFLSMALICCWNNLHAEDKTYEFKGHFAPTNISVPANAEFIPRTPPEVVGVPFTVRFSLSDSPSQYSTDFQTGSNKFGEYMSETIAFNINAPGLAFAFPTGVNGSQMTWNDSQLKDSSSGDQIEFRRRIGVLHTVEFTDYDFETGLVIGTKEFTFQTDYLMSLFATDHSGTALSNDLLNTDVDFSRFDDIHFEFKQLIPVASSDPRPIVFGHWVGTVESIQVIPEPGLSLFVCSFVAVVVVGRLRSRGMQSTASKSEEVRRLDS